jgi:hypothetical protein
MIDRLEFHIDGAAGRESCDGGSDVRGSTEGAACGLGL